jgi:peroxiredoxin
VEKHPNSIHSAYVLSVYSTTWGKEKTKELYDNLSIEIKQTEFGKEIADYIKLNKNPEIGDSYVDFEMEDPNGEIRRLSEFEGKLVLLEFWGSGCLPCRQENPNLVKTYRKYQPKGFEIFAVSQDTKKESWLRAIEKDGLPWTQVSDLKGQGNIASLIYGISYIPNNFLIDQNGVIIGRNIRGDNLDRKLEELFN